MTDITRNPLFNPKGTDETTSRRMVGGNATGLFNLNDVKYSWAKPMYQVMIGNFWVPEKVKGLTDDSIQYKQLTPHEQHAYDGVLSFLIFLDSLQTVNVPNFSDYITAPEVKLLLSIQSYQEAIHSQSYATILETVVDSKKRDEIYYFWREDKVLLDRITYIGNLYQKFLDNPSEDNFFEALIANYLLEGLYFYNGFAFFDTLVYNSKMTATGRMISYIRRDELTHVTLFANIIKAIDKENAGFIKKDKLEEMFRTAVEQEVTWSHHIFGDRVSGITKAAIEQYTKHLANTRISLLGYDPLYPEVVKSPFIHLERMADNNSEKTNFFESTVVNYTQSSSLNGSWDF